MTPIRMGDQLPALVLAKSVGRGLDTNAERVETHAQMSTHSPAVKLFVNLGFRSFALGIGNWGWRSGRQTLTDAFIGGARSSAHYRDRTKRNKRRSIASNGTFGHEAVRGDVTTHVTHVETALSLTNLYRWRCSHQSGRKCDMNAQTRSRGRTYLSFFGNAFHGAIISQYGSAARATR
jgi:hypothetical protein